MPKVDDLDEVTLKRISLGHPSWKGTIVKLNYHRTIGSSDIEKQVKEWLEECTTDMYDILQMSRYQIVVQFKDQGDAAMFRIQFDGIEK